MYSGYDLVFVQVVLVALGLCETGLSEIPLLLALQIDLLCQLCLELLLISFEVNFLGSCIFQVIADLLSERHFLPLLARQPIGYLLCLIILLLIFILEVIFFLIIIAITVVFFLNGSESTPQRLLLLPPLS